MRYNIRTSQILLNAVVLFQSAILVAAGTTIKCDDSTIHQVETSRIATCELPLVSDLSTLDSITFEGIDSGLDETVFFMKTSATVRDLQFGGQEIVWTGATPDWEGFATLVQTPSGSFSGSFSSHNGTFSLFTTPEGSIAVKATAWKDYPQDKDDDLESLENGEDATETGLTADSVYLPDTSGSPVLDDTNVGEEVLHRRKLRESHKLLSYSHRNLQDEDVSLVDVLVLVTQHAACLQADLRTNCALTEENRAPMTDRIPVLESQTNLALQEVDIPVRIRVVEVIFLKGSFDGRPSSSTLVTLTRDDNVKQWRDEVGADLVAMLTGPDTRRIVCGIAYLNSPVSATSVTCLDQFTFTHELGHNFGGNHDRTSTPVFQRHPYGHGFQSGNNFRTLMAYDCLPFGCPVVPYFSADGYALSDGRPIGDATHDNARLIRENRARVAAFRDEVIPVEVTPTVSPRPTLPPAMQRDPTRSPLGLPATPLTCPASDECPGENLVRLRIRLFGISFNCREACVREGSARQFLYEVLGYRCGAC